MNSKKRKGQYMPFNALKGYYESLKEVEEELELLLGFNKVFKLVVE